MNVKLSESEKIKILNSDDLYAIMQRILLREDKIDQDREHFWVIGLANSSRLLFVELISMGSINKTIAEPMEVFSLALQKRAVNIILAHNHPSGEILPSEGDKDITDRLIQVGIIVDTKVLDHLIITKKDYLSFGNVGLMKELNLSTKYVPPYVLQQRMKKEAKEVGIKAGKEEIAKKCLNEGLEIEMIVKLTGFSEKVIERIKKKMKS